MDMKETDDLTEGELLDVQRSTGEASEGESALLKTLRMSLTLGILWE